jgi:hypothetical protein
LPERLQPLVHVATRSSSRRSLPRLCLQLLADVANVAIAMNGAAMRRPQRAGPCDKRIHDGSQARHSNNHDGNTATWWSCGVRDRGGRRHRGVAARGVPSTGPGQASAAPGNCPGTLAHQRHGRSSSCLEHGLVEGTASRSETAISSCNRIMCIMCRSHDVERLDANHHRYDQPCATREAVPRVATLVAFPGHLHL